MDTYTELSYRLDKLAVRLGEPSEFESADLKTLINRLKSKLNEIYDDNNEFVTLNRIMKDLKLWKQVCIQPNVNADGTDLLQEQNFLKSDSTISDTGGDEVDLHQKLLLIKMKYPVIVEAYNNLNELSRMDIPKIINHIDVLQDKQYKYDEIHAKLQSKKQDIINLSKQMHQLVIKNMIIFERYLALMIRENNFWFEVESKIQQLNKRVNSVGKQNL